jgi:hypothetical protein
MNYLVVSNNSNISSTRIFTREELTKEHQYLVDHWEETFGSIPDKIGVCQISESACSLSIDLVKRIENTIIVEYTTVGDCEELLDQLVLIEVISDQDSIVKRRSN